MNKFKNDKYIMKTILIVEDNKSIRNEIVDVFKMENYNVIEASNGLDGYVKAINELPDIIVSDLIMPILNGFEMFKQLRNNELTELIPIIFLSALSSDENIRKGMNLGADDYLTKPISPSNLILATANKLEKYSKVETKFDKLKINITNILYHELNTPLNGIIGFSDYLRTRVYEMQKDDIKEIVENIYLSGIRLYNLVKKYLCYADLKMKYDETSKVKELRNCNYINIKQEINNVLDYPSFKKRKNDFKKSINNAKIRIDKTLFMRMIEELIENAIKFSNKKHKIYISSNIKNENFIIKIKNEGIGLSSEQIKNIDDFCQFNKEEFAQNGSGIGLSIVKLICEIYNVKFEIESIPYNFFTAKLTFKHFKRN